MVPGQRQVLNVDVSRIEQPEMRKAMRSLIQQTQEALNQQQIELEALLEFMLEKHIGSQSEYRILVQRISQRASERVERLHQQVSHVMKETPTGLQANPRDIKEAQEEERHVYRL